MTATISRKAHFNAAHRLYNKDWSDQKNKDVFGKCSNPYYHGHNYELIVSLTGPINEDTGYVYDMKVLRNLIEEQVEQYMDHKNLNEQVHEFMELNPTVENIAVVIYNRLAHHIESHLNLKITLFETPRNYVEYWGE